MSVFDKFIKKDNFVSLPDIASRLLEILQADEIDTNEIVRLIESDPIISMKVLKMANSPVFHVRDQIVDLRQAMNILGTKRVTDIVFSVSLHSKLFIGRNLDIYPLLEKYFYNSYLVGNISKIFTDFLHDSSKNGLFVSGLLHDIGRMIMIQIEPLDYVKVMNLTEKEKISEIEAEYHVFKESHVGVGTQLAQVWSLPEMVHSVIQHYRNPEKADKFKELNYGVNSSKESVDGLSSNDLTDLQNFDITKLKRYQDLNKLLHIDAKRDQINTRIKKLIKTLPDSYVLFK